MKLHNKLNKRHVRCKLTDLRSLKREKERLFLKMALYSQKDIESLSLYLPKIKKEDHFFTSSDTSNCSYINTEDYGNSLFMTQGYASAALFFLKVIGSSNSKYMKACYINPCLFCFRHYMELILKDTLWYYSQCTPDAVGLEKVKKEHNLAVLWNQLLKQIGRRDETTRHIGRLVHEFSEYDNSGTTFRYSYSFNTNGRKDNDKLQILIDNKILYTRMLQIFSYMEGLRDEITNNLDEMSSYNN